MSLVEKVMKLNNCSEAAALLILQKEVRTQRQRWIQAILGPWFPTYLFQFQDAVRDLGRCHTRESVKTSLEYSASLIHHRSFISRFFLIHADLAMAVFDRHQQLPW